MPMPFGSGMPIGFNQATNLNNSFYPPQQSQPQAPYPIQSIQNQYGYPVNQPTHSNMGYSNFGYPPQNFQQISRPQNFQPYPTTQNPPFGGSAPSHNAYPSYSAPYPNQMQSTQQNPPKLPPRNLYPNLQQAYDPRSNPQGQFNNRHSAAIQYLKKVRDHLV